MSCPQKLKTYQKRIKTPSDVWFRIRTCSAWFASPAVQLCQRFALHLELHLRILLEYLRVSLPYHLRHPLVGHAARTQPRGERGTKIIEPEIPNLSLPKRGCPSFLKLSLVPGPVTV